MRPFNLSVLFGQERKSLNSRKTLSYLYLYLTLSYEKGDGQGVVITKAFSLSTTYKILSNSFSKVKFHRQMTEDHLC